MKVLAIIPARSGSKGVPLKNTKKINNKPLVQYTIDASKKSKIIDRIIVSTDSLKIANICKKLGVEVPFLRPKNISGDNVPMQKVVSHAVRFLEKKSYFPDIIVLLQPTSPFRTYKEIDKAIRIFSKSKSTSLVEVRKTNDHPYKSFKRKEEFIVPLEKDFEKFHARQKLPEIVFPTGSLFIFWNKTLKKYNSIYGNKIMSVLQEKPTIDIDTEFDFFIAEMMVKFSKFRKN